MVSEEDQEQDKPNNNGSKSTGDSREDEKGRGNVADESTDDANDAEHDDKTSSIDGRVNQSDSVAVGSQEDVKSPDTEVAVEKQEQLDNDEEYHVSSPSPSPTQSPSPTGSGCGKGENKDDEPEEEEDQLDSEKLLVTEIDTELPDVKEEKPNPEEVSVSKTESELLPPERETRVEEADEDDDEYAELNSVKEAERPQLAIDVVQEESVEFKTLQNQRSFLLEPNSTTEDESGTEEDQAAFMKELEVFHKERCLEFKPPRFYGEPLNCLKLWRSVIRHGGYEQVTSCKVWRQVGESFKPPKTCTTVSWTFRCFYEKALLEYEKYKMSIGELPFTDAVSAEPASVGKQTSQSQTPGSGRARRDAAARAMQGWHSQRLLGNGEVGDPIIKDKNISTTIKREKQSIGLLKRKKPSSVERAVKVARMKTSKPHLDSMVVDVGPPADWVKINVQRTKDCFEVYALVPGLLREEVRVQSDPAGRLVISGQPEQLDNPWGVSPFKKVVSLPSRIDPHQTSAVVTLHGQLFVRVPFEQSEV